jgi:starch synthase
MHVLFAASETVPFIKTGGLADVVGELPLSLAKQGVKVSVVIPKYSSIKSALLKDAKFIKSFEVYMNNQKVYAGIYLLVQNNIDYYFIDNESLFKRDNIYGYFDDDARFGFFNLAVMEMISHLQMKVDVVHAHDWQCGPLAMLYYEKYHNYPYYENINWVFTIHNPAYQGLYDPKIIQTIFGLDMNLYHNGTLRFKDAFSFLKVGIVYANRITTVSKTHALELLDASYAYGLEGVIGLRKNDLIGILNGFDYNKYSPLKDKNIKFNYKSSYPKKLLNKEALQKRCGLRVDKEVPLIAIISRLTWQKGIDLISPHVDDFINKNIQLVVLGIFILLITTA